MLPNVTNIALKPRTFVKFVTFGNGLTTSSQVYASFPLSTSDTLLKQASIFSGV